MGFSCHQTWLVANYRKKSREQRNLKAEVIAKGNDDNRQLQIKDEVGRPA